MASADRPGLFAERTELSWRRSALTVTVAALLAARAAVLAWPGAVAAAVVVILGAVVISMTAVGWRRAQVLRRSEAETDGPPVTSAKVWLTTIGVLAIATVGIAATLSG